MFQSTRHCLEQRGGMPGLILRWLWWGEVTLHDLKAASPFVIKVAVMLQFGFAVHSVVCKWLQATVQATVQYTVHSRCIVCTGGCATWKNVPCHTFLAPMCCVTDLGVTIWSYTTHNVLSQVVPWFQWLLQCLPFGMTIMIFFTDTPQKVKVRKAYVRWIYVDVDGNGNGGDSDVGLVMGNDVWRVVCGYFFARPKFGQLWSVPYYYLSLCCFLTPHLFST